MNMRTIPWRTLQRTSFWLGAAALVYAGGTVAHGAIAQRQASRIFDARVAAASARPVTDGSAAVDTPLDLSEGAPIGRLDVLRVGISVIVLQGVDETTLVSGAGHVPGTPSPGGDGNVVIAAHRDTFFRKLEGVMAGDHIRITTTRGRYEYVIDSTEIVDPEDTRVMESRARNELTLLTCYPFYFVGSAPKRFVVHARPE